MTQAVKTGPVVVSCKQEWDQCQKKQMCAKVKSLSEEAKKGNLKKREVTPRLKKVKKSWQAKYRRDNPQPGGRYTDDCAKTNNKEVDADHVIDAQWGGNARGPFEYLDASVNRSIGSQMDKKDIDVPTDVTADSSCGCK